MRSNEVALLELDCDENVSGSAEREDEMRDCHHRCGPEHQQPSDVERVADDSVHSGSVEGKIRVRDATEIQPDLAEAKQVEVVDEKCRGEEDDHAETKQSI